MIIDCHTHLNTAASNKESVTGLLESMDEANIDVSIIIAETSEDNTSNLEAILKSTAGNSRLPVVANCVYSKIKDVDYAAELAKVLQINTVVGLKFYLGYEQYSPMDAALYPLYEYCQAKQITVMFHTGVLETGSTGLLKYSHPLLIDEVANLYPKLPIVMAHMGNPWLMDCAAVLAKNQHVYADVSGFFEENVTIEPNDVAVFKSRMQEIRVFLGNYNKFLFGSDWPLYSQKEYVSAVASLEMDEPERELVMWRNASKLFRIKKTEN